MIVAQFLHIHDFLSLPFSQQGQELGGYNVGASNVNIEFFIEIGANKALAMY